MKITPDQLVQNLADSGLMSADEASSLCSSLSTVTGPADTSPVHYRNYACRVIS